MLGRRLLPVIFSAFFFAAGCHREPPSETTSGSADRPWQGTPTKMSVRHLPNAWQIHPRVICGGEPAGAEAFRELRDLGVKTIISVDAAKPDLARARQYDLQYVHLPHGYAGIPAPRVQELAKAVRDLTGPIYIHCHHGKHRGPTAAAVACVAAGLLPPDKAEQVLELAGTSGQYQGLYSLARSIRPLKPLQLDQMASDFPEVAEVSPLAQIMIELDDRFSELKRLEQAGWRPLSTDADAAPAHIALLFREHWTEWLRNPAIKQQPEPYGKWIEESESLAIQLEQRLRNGNPADNPEPKADLGELLAALGQNCSACHRAYRDNPPEE